MLTDKSFGAQGVMEDMYCVGTKCCRTWIWASVIILCANEWACIVVIDWNPKPSIHWKLCVRAQACAHQFDVQHIVHVIILLMGWPPNRCENATYGCLCCCCRQCTFEKWIEAEIRTHTTPRISVPLIVSLEHYNLSCCVCSGFQRRRIADIFVSIYLMRWILCVMCVRKMQINH